MWLWQEILTVAEEMGVDLVWWKHCANSDAAARRKYLCKGQAVSVLTKSGRPLFRFVCTESGTPEYARLIANENNPFTHRLMLHRLASA